jgi:NADH-quinone oxidoreductase subunit A
LSGFFLAYFVKSITKLEEGYKRMETFDLWTYIPIFIYLAVILGVAASMLIVAHAIGPKRQTVVKQMPYESGMDPIGDARQRFDVKFYLIAMLFLVFDVELLFLYPWATVAYAEGEGGIPDVMRGPVFITMLVFLGTLALAYVCAWRRGVFKWH